MSPTLMAPPQPLLGACVATAAPPRCCHCQRPHVPSSQEAPTPVVLRLGPSLETFPRQAAMAQTLAPAPSRQEAPTVHAQAKPPRLPVWVPELVKETKMSQMPPTRVCSQRLLPMTACSQQMLPMPASSQRLLPMTVSTRRHRSMPPRTPAQVLLPPQTRFSTPRLPVAQMAASTAAHRVKSALVARVSPPAPTLLALPYRAVLVLVALPRLMS